MVKELDVFTYQDYRDFLRDFYLQRRQIDRKFSIRFFARRAGLKSENYLKVVMDGRRNLTAKNLPKFVKGLGLGPTQAEYFEALVNLNQSKDLNERRDLLERIVYLKKKKTVVTLAGSQLEFFSHWYNIVIFELAGQPNFNPSPEWISKALQNKVTPKQASESLKMMLKTGILNCDESGKFTQVASRICSPADVPREQVRKLQDSFIQKSLEALHLQNEHERAIRGLTISVRKEQVPLFMAKIADFQRELNTLFSTGNGEDVYQLNVQFFRLTKSSENSFSPD